MILQTDITDPLFLKLETAQQTTYFTAGLSQYASYCVQYKIGDTLIPTTPIPYTPARLQTVCVLIAVAKDFVGSEWRQVREGLTIDVYQAKLNTLNAELAELLTNFTAEMCGYDDGNEEGTSVSINYARA